MDPFYRTQASSRRAGPSFTVAEAIAPRSMLAAPPGMQQDQQSFARMVPPSGEEPVIRSSAAPVQDVFSDQPLTLEQTPAGQSLMAGLVSGAPQDQSPVENTSAVGVGRSGMEFSNDQDVDFEEMSPEEQNAVLNQFEQNALKIIGDYFGRQQATPVRQIGTTPPQGPTPSGRTMDNPVTRSPAWDRGVANVPNYRPAPVTFNRTDAQGRFQQSSFAPRPGWDQAVVPTERAETSIRYYQRAADRASADPRNVADRNRINRLPLRFRANG